jgi:hypothetical protein
MRTGIRRKNEELPPVKIRPVELAPFGNPVWYFTAHILHGKYMLDRVHIFHHLDPELPKEPIRHPAWQAGIPEGRAWIVDKGCSTVVL